MRPSTTINTALGADLHTDRCGCQVAHIHVGANTGLARLDVAFQRQDGRGFHQSHQGGSGKNRYESAAPFGGDIIGADKMFEAGGEAGIEFGHAGSFSTRKVAAVMIFALRMIFTFFDYILENRSIIRAGVKMPTIYPFTAIVGQERMRRALILNAVDPRIGGVLIRGERGTAKSTAARALAALLPKVRVVRDCRFGCDPDQPTSWCTECRERAASASPCRSMKSPFRFVNLPVSATEDRVVGTLDIEKAIQKGERHFEAGVLAAANRGLLYIDEVNLLDDHVVDVLLDSAAMGMNIVEREGISFAHPARFILVGTMNPEEGDLRPQLLDRFALSVEITGIRDARDRVKIIENNLAFEAEPGSLPHSLATA